MRNWEELYGRNEDTDTFSLYLEDVIWRAYKQTGKQVFILVDEYDSPMLDSMEDKQLQKRTSDINARFLQPKLIEETFNI